MTIALAIAVPDGIALAADTQTTYTKTITKAKEKGTNKEFELATLLSIPVTWSKMTRKLFPLKLNNKSYAVCIAGTALLNSKTIYSIFKSLEKKYQGADDFNKITEYFILGIKEELKKHLNIKNLSEATTILSVSFILAGYEGDDIAKPRLEVNLVFSGKINGPNGQVLDNGHFKQWDNTNSRFNCCWVGRSEFVVHLVTHNNKTLPKIQGYYDVLSL